MNGSHKQQSKEALKDESSEELLAVRQGLIRFFMARGCLAPEDLADETMTRVISRLHSLKSHYEGDLVQYLYGVARLVYLEHVRSRPRFTPDSTTEVEEVAKAPSNAAMYLQLLANSIVNLLVLVLVVIFDRGLLIVARWILPENSFTHLLFNYLELGVFFLAVISSLFLVLHSLFRFYTLQRQRILSRLEVTEDQFYQKMRNNVRGLLGGSI
jgi:hypothetical protein